MLLYTLGCQGRETGMREKGIESRSMASATICIILDVIITLIYNHFCYAGYQVKSTLHTFPTSPLTSTRILRSKNH